jgi:DNA-directed RNA polymerase specialized sigma24 family protein
MAPDEDSAALLDFAAISTHASAVENKNRLVLRYSDAILGYATAILGDRHDAEDVHMHIVQNMLEGRFSPAAAGGTQPGRFRFYVKKAVHHAVVNHVRQRDRQRGRLKRWWERVFPGRGAARRDLEEAAAPPADADLEEKERRIWQATVLQRALDAALQELQAYEERHQDRSQPNVYHTLARLLVEHSDATSEELARLLEERAHGNYNANQVRGIVLRMRRKLAELLLAEIIPQLDDPSEANVLDELRDLGLLGYVRPYLPG